MGGGRPGRPHLAGETLVYASDNAPLGDGTKSFLAVTTQHFYRVHEGQLYTKVPLAELTGISVRKMGFLRDDKLVLSLVGGREDTAGVSSAAAMAEYVRILGAVAAK